MQVFFNCVFYIVVWACDTLSSRRGREGQACVLQISYQHVLTTPPRLTLHDEALFAPTFVFW